VAERLTFTAYTELVLARLYEAHLREPARQYFNVDELMSDLAGSVPDGWAWDAAQYLVDHDLGHDFISSGTPDTALTPTGRVFVESEQGTGIIGEYQRAGQVIVVTGDGNQVAVGHGQQVVQIVQGDLSKEEAIELLGQAEARLAEDQTLSDDERADALADVHAIRTQLEKNAPNREALKALVTGLAGVASIADIVAKLSGAF
jgi:hypothetical protein